MNEQRRVTGLGGVFLKAEDPKRLGAWYQEHLGIPVGDGGFAIFPWRERDDASREGNTIWALFDRSSDYFGRPEQTAMLNYRVADLDAVLADLRREGIAVEDTVQSSDEGRFSWITDPEGNRIELWEPPAGG